MDLYQTELYQDSTNYHELEKIKITDHFLLQLTPVTGKLLHFLGHIITQLVFVTCRTYIINVDLHDLLFNALNPSLSLDQANVSKRS